MSKNNLHKLNIKIEDLVQYYLDKGLDPSLLARIFARHAVQINLLNYTSNEENKISDKDFRDLFSNIFEGIGMPFFLSVKNSSDTKCANDNQKLIHSLPLISNKNH